MNVIPFLPPTKGNGHPTAGQQRQIRQASHNAYVFYKPLAKNGAQHRFKENNLQYYSSDKAAFHTRQPAQTQTSRQKRPEANMK